jgi:hypothetical protein
MRVSCVDGVYKASRITGPKHNYLGIRFAVAQSTSLTVAPRRLADEEPTVIEELLVEAVNAGIQSASLAIGIQLFPQTIEYVPSDTADHAAYKSLAAEITQSAAPDFAT